MKIKKILVEVDPRKRNTPALERGQAVAHATGAKIVLLACESLPPLAGGAIVDAGVMEQAQREFLSDLEDWASALAKSVQDDGIEVDIRTSADRPRHEAVIEHARDCGADLVIREASHHGRLERMFLGAADWELIRHCDRPLWLVQTEEFRADNLEVMAAVDPTHPDDDEMNLDQRILDTARTLAEATQGGLHVYHAVPTAAAVTSFPAGGETLAPPMPDFQPEFVDKVRSVHEQKLKDLVAPLDLPDDNIHLVEGDATASVNDVIDANSINVVVAGAISRGWLERMLIGSTAESLFNAIDCDLVVVRPATKQEEE